MSSQGYEWDLLRAWFPDFADQSRTAPFNEKAIREISSILGRTQHGSWSRIPRIYILLRLVNQLDLIDDFLEQGITDVWFPFTEKSLPGALVKPSTRLKFLELQHLVYNTEALNLEQDHARHGHFRDPNDIPLKTIGELGKGGSGYVDRVISTVTYREYARKLIPRGRTFRKDKKVLQNFERELANLKRLSQSQKHIVQLAGSYTDPRYVGILTSPVAECNLAEFMELPDLNDRRWLLRAFFGCLASALGFLHDNKIRHKDVKPSNVLLKDNDILLTDFGLSFDWTQIGHSTTTGDTGATPRYASPEVASYQPRNSSSDIWSLGCVFLEMWTVLKQKSLHDLKAHMSTDGQLAPYHTNDSKIPSWITLLEKLPGRPSDNVPIEWIESMLLQNPDKRWSAHKVLGYIKECSSDDTTQYLYIGRCCLEDEDSAESVVSFEGEDKDAAFEQRSKSKARVRAHFTNNGGFGPEDDDHQPEYASDASNSSWEELPDAPRAPSPVPRNRKEKETGKETKADRKVTYLHKCMVSRTALELQGYNYDIVSEEELHGGGYAVRGILSQDNIDALIVETRQIILSIGFPGEKWTLGQVLKFEHASRERHPELRSPQYWKLDWDI